MQAEEAALLAVDMAAAERRIRSSLDTHISELRQQLESEQRVELSEHIKQQEGPGLLSAPSVESMLGLLHIMIWTIVLTPFRATDCTSSP